MPAKSAVNLPRTSDMGKQASDVFRTAWQSYKAHTTPRIRVIDSYAGFCVSTALVLHFYATAFGSFPFNAYLAAILACIGGFVLADACHSQKRKYKYTEACPVCLRMQLDKTNTEFSTLPPERAYADYILAHFALLFAAWNYIG